jgi:tetratricopeptide (TPR) repeat protein
MPPWKPQPGHGEFAGSRRLTDRELDLFRRWAADGAPEGGPAALPAAPAYSDAWQLGTPDLVVTMPEPYLLAADGADVFRTFALPVPAAAPRYVSAVEFRVPATTAVHHANIKLDESGASRRLDEAEADPGFDGGSSREARFPDGHFLGWTPGQSPQRLTDTAWQLPPNSDLVVEAHMQPTGRRESIRISIGLYFTDTPPSRVPYMIRLGSQRIDIPAGEGEYVSSDEYVLPVDVEVRRVQPHAHNLARRIEGHARRPDGSSEWLIDIPDWDFRWQDVYEYAKPLILPAGTTLSMRYTYDNSGGNARNPHRPPRRVTFGQTSSSEMGDLWLQVVTRNPADRARLDADYAPKMLREDIAGVEKALETTPLDARLHADLALCYIEAGRIADAVASFERSLALDPRSAGTQYDLGTLLLRERRYADARRRLEAAVAIKPDFSEAYNNLGTVHFAEGRHEEALRSYREAVRIDPYNSRAHYNLGRVLATREQWELAVMAFEEALELMPRDADTNAALGSSLAAIGKIPEAVHHYRVALATDPDLPAALADLAWILATSEEASIRNPGEAVRLAERLGTLTRREDATALDTLAVAYFSAGRLNDAIATAKAALDRAKLADLNELAERIALRLQFYERR